MNCLNCGQVLEEGARFCRNCGQAVTPAAQQPAQPPAYQQPAQPPAYQQQPQQQYGGYPAAGAGFKLPPNWKIYLPVLGSVLALLGFLLPWLSAYGVSLSGFNIASMASQAIGAGYSDSLTTLFVVAFWIGFICSFAGAVIFWKHPYRRMIAAGVGGVGLLMMILTAIGFGDLGGAGIGFGYILCWIGFAVIVGGTIFAWKDLEVTPSAPPPYIPPAQNY
jgi:hypothetical protein